MADYPDKPKNPSTSSADKTAFEDAPKPAPTPTPKKKTKTGNESMDKQFPEVED